MSTARRDTHPSPLTQLTLVRCTNNNSSRSHIQQGSSHGGPLQALGVRQAQLASGVPVCLLLRLGASNQLLPPRPHHNSSLLAPLQLIGQQSQASDFSKHTLMDLRDELLKLDRTRA